MTYCNQLKSAVLQVKQENFEELALQVFHFQAEQNPVYAQYLSYLDVNLSEINNIYQIPFLPIQFFKYHRVIAANAPTQFVFESSGTTGQQTSKHYINDLPFYEQISRQIFEYKYGNLSDFVVLALLPSYLERNTSSLVYMVQNFIEKTYSEQSGFYLNNTEDLIQKLKNLKEENAQKKILLIGVTFALLDLVEKYKNLLPTLNTNLIVMETGGMKGRKKELLREEIHKILKNGFGLDKIHSEYGMTELLSQAYSDGDGIFETPNSMKILLREINDPFAYNQKQGAINVIDLANIDSCSFIETQDLGTFNAQNNTFQVIGRIDNSDIRGCNLLFV